MEKILLFEKFILEGKTSQLIHKYKDKISEFVLDNLKRISNESPHNLKWLLENYTKDKNKYKTDPSGASDLLFTLETYFKKFLSIKQNLKISDINEINDVNELVSIVDKYYNYDELLNSPYADILYSDYNWIYYIPKKYEIVKKFGYSKFCTSRDKDLFELYNVKDSALIYILNKFDYTKNFVLEQSEPGYFKLWDYQDDLVFGNLEDVEMDFINKGDSYFNIGENDIPHIDLIDYKEHFINIVKKDALDDELLDAYEINIDNVGDDEIFEIKQFLEAY